MKLINRKKRTQKKAMLQRLAAWVRNQERRIINCYRRTENQYKGAWQEKAERDDVLNSMTNWQRNKFMIAVKGKVNTASLGMMQDYAGMPHWKKTRQAA